MSHLLVDGQKEDDASLVVLDNNFQGLESKASRGITGTGRVTFNKKDITIDKLSFEINDLLLTFSDTLPVDAFMGHYDQEKKLFEINVMGETYYSIKIASVQQDTNEDQFSLESSFENINIVASNSVINFKRVPTKDNIYRYNLIDMLSPINLFNKDKQEYSRSYDRFIFRVNENKNIADVLNRLGSRTLNAKINFYNSYESTSVVHTYNSVINVANIQRSPILLEEDLYFDTYFIELNLGVDEEGIKEDFICHVVPMDQNLNMADKFDSFCKMPMLVRCTEGESPYRLEPLEDVITKVENIYTYNDKSENTWQMILSWTEKFGNANVSKIALMIDLLWQYKLNVSETTSESILNGPIKQALDKFDIVLATKSAQSISYENLVTLQLSNAMFNNANIPEISEINVNPYSQIAYHFQVANDISGLDFSVIRFCMHSDIAIMAGKSLDRYLSDSSLTNFKSFFGDYYYTLLAFFALTPRNIHEIWKDAYNNGNYDYLLRMEIGSNLSIFTGKSVSNWTDETKITASNDDDMNKYNDFKEMCMGVIKLSQDRKMPVRTLLTKDFTWQDIGNTKNTGIINMLKECVYPLDLIVTNVANTIRNQGGNSYLHKSLGVFQYYCQNKLAISSDTQMQKYLSKWVGLLNQAVRQKPYDNSSNNISEAIKYAESSFNIFDLVMIPKDLSADKASYGHNFSVDYLNSNLHYVNINGLPLVYYNFKDLLGGNSASIINNKLIIDISNIDRTNIKDFAISNTVFFKHRESNSVDYLRTINVNYYDHNYKNIGFVSKDIQIAQVIDEEFDLIISNFPENLDDESLYANYVAKIEFTDTIKDHLDNLQYIELDMSKFTADDPWVFDESVLFWNKDIEGLDDIAYPYLQTLKDTYESKQSIENVMAFYYSTMIDGSSFVGSTQLYLDIVIPNDIMMNNIENIYIDFYSSSRRLSSKFLTKEDLSLQDDVYTLKTIIENDLLQWLEQGMNEIAVQFFVKSDVDLSLLSKLGLKMIILTHQNYFDYIPNYSYDQTYTTAAYKNNVITISEGNSIINNYPGVNNFILNPGSYTTIEHKVLDVSDNRCTFVLLGQVDGEVSLLHGQEGLEDDLYINWTADGDSSQVKNMFKFMQGQRNSIKSSSKSSRLIIKNYFSKLAAQDISLNINDQLYQIDSEKDANNQEKERLFLRRIVSLENIKEDDDLSVVYDKNYNVIIGKIDEILKPSPSGKDILIAPDSYQSIIFNSINDTTIITGSDGNIVNLIHGGNDYVRIMGKTNEINIENTIGVKIFDIKTTTPQTTTMNISDFNINSWYINENSLQYIDEILPITTQINDPDDQLAQAFFIPVLSSDVNNNTEAEVAKNFFGISFQLMLTEELDSNYITLVSTDHYYDDINDVERQRGLSCKINKDNIVLNWQDDENLGNSVTLIQTLNNLLKIYTNYYFIIYVDFVAENFKGLLGYEIYEENYTESTQEEDRVDIDCSLFDSSNITLNYDATERTIEICRDGFWTNTNMFLPEAFPKNSKTYIIQHFYKLSKLLTIEEVERFLSYIEFGYIENSEDADNYEFLNFINKLICHYAEGNPFLVVLLNNVLLLDKRHWKEIYVNGFSVQDLVMRMKYNKEYRLSNQQAYKDKMEPILQAGMFSLVNVNRDNSDQQGKDRISFYNLKKIEEVRG